MEFMNQLRATFNKNTTKDLNWRKSQLNALKTLLEEQEEAICTAVQKDLAKCSHEAYVAEIATVKHDIKLFLKNLKKWSSPKTVGTPLAAQPGVSKIKPEPYGVSLIMGAWNYPVQLVLSPMAAAIAAGNCVVLKPSELSWNTSNLLAELIPRYMDTNAFAVVEGGVEETTELLKQRFDYIMYTGSENVGKIVMRAASEYLTPVTLELGGKSPCVVDDNTNLKVTADRIVWAKFMNAGQTCVAPDYILVTPKQRPALVDALKASLIEQYGEHVKDSTEFGRIVNERHAQRLIAYLDGQEDNIIHGGKHELAEKFIEPTLLLNPALDSKIMQDEIFGPLLPIIEIGNMNDAVDFIKEREKPLAQYLFTNNNRIVEQFNQETSAGTFCVNDALIFMVNSNLPFGGVGNSGMGAYHGKHGFDMFSHPKAFMHRSFWFDAPFRYAPFTTFKEKVMRFVLG